MLRSVMHSTIRQVCQLSNLRYKISGDISQINSVYLSSVPCIAPLETLLVRPVLYQKEYILVYARGSTELPKYLVFVQLGR